MAIVRSQESLPTPQCCYDVFLSFRGEDTRKTFTDHLYTALVQAGFHTFRDNDSIRRGETIEPKVQKAIEQSKISIIVFSKTYADSTWCLNELLKILYCKKTSRHLVLPVFYDVDPSVVRKQTGSFAEAFTRHEIQCEAKTDERKNELMKQVESWRTALREVSDLAGMVLQNQSDGYEAKFIQIIVEVIRDRVDCGVLRITPFLIGIDHRVKDINLWLQDGRMDASVYVICGIGGIGKTTIAKVVYNLNKGNFDGSSFLANITESSKTPSGLVKVQEQLLSDIGRKQIVRCVDGGITKIKDAICCRRVLLILDDVDEVEQVDAVFGMPQWFSTGSKVIITTRHRCLFKAYGVHRVHEVEHLNYEESLELLSLHAFGQHHPPDDYIQILERVVHHCGGIPFALQVLGSNLASKSLSVWESALEKLKIIPNNLILRKLEISYCSLPDDNVKDIFLHIACFFIGWDKDWIIKILDQCDLYTEIGIQILVDRCLLTIDKHNKLRMHQLIQNMGREIVRQESPKQLGKRSRLWRHNDSLHVLSQKTGTDTIEGLILDTHKLEEDTLGTAGFINIARKCAYEGSFLRNLSTVISLDTDTFVNMNNLKFLQLNYIEITGCLKKFPNNLRGLCLDGFPLESIPSDFSLENLVALQMHHSCLIQIWTEFKFLNQLKMLDLSHSYELTKTPDFSGLPKLEILILEDCISLVEFPMSIGELERLILLNLKDCKNLKKFPGNICKLKSIETLIISGCSNLDWLPNNLGSMSSLKVLHADGVDIYKVFSTVEEVQPWHAVTWSGLLKPQKSSGIPVISLPRSLVKLSLAGCNLSDDDFPSALSSLSFLEKLDLSTNQICSLPESTKTFSRLDQLKVNSCRRLQSLSFSRDFNLDVIFGEQKLSDPIKKFDLSCLDCDNLSKIEGFFKLEPLKDVDIQILMRLGFVNLNTTGHVVVNYVYSDKNIFSGYCRKVPLQRVCQRGVCNYFLPGNTIPDEFSIRSTGSHLSFVVPSIVYYKIRGLVVCSLYRNCVNVQREAGRLFIELKNMSKHAESQHHPTIFGIANPEENLLWISHWNVGNRLQEGDLVEVNVGMETFSVIEVKEVGIQLIYELLEENGTPSMFDAAISQFSVSEYPSQLRVGGGWPLWDL